MSIETGKKAVRSRSRGEGKPRARREDPEVRRQELLRATVTCLAKFGANKTTGREICRQAGVSHSLLGHYFGNPQTLLLEAYDQLSDQFNSRIETDIALHDDPWEALDCLFKLHFSDEWAGSDVVGAWIAFWTLVRAREDFAAVRDRFNRRLIKIIEQILSRLPPGEGALPTADAAAIIGGVMDGIWLEFGLARKSMSRSRAIRLCNETARLVMGHPPRGGK